MTRTRTTTVLASLTIALAALASPAQASEVWGVPPTPTNPAGCDVIPGDITYVPLSELVRGEVKLRCRLDYQDGGTLTAQMLLHDRDGSYPPFGPGTSTGLERDDNRDQVTTNASCHDGLSEGWKLRGVARYVFGGETFRVRDTGPATVIVCE